MPIDFTKNNQLAGVSGMTLGLDVPQLYPYQTAEGEVAAIATFEDWAGNGRPTLGDYEPERETLPFQTDGTIGIASGVVTKSGGDPFANYAGNVILGRIYVGENIYDVASRQSDTQLTLVNTSVNVSPGAAYKWARWSHREIDPKYAFNAKEWQDAHDELAYPMQLVRTTARASGTPACLYDFIALAWRNALDIIDDLDAGLYEQWQGHVQTVCSYRNSQGFTIVEYLREVGGLLVWDSEVPAVFDNGPTNRARWLVRNGRIMDTLDALNVPNAPLVMRHTIEGLDEFLNTGTGTEVSEGLQRAIIAQAHERRPGNYGWWGVAGQYAGYTLPATILAEQQAAADPFKPSWSRGSNELLGVS